MGPGSGEHLGQRHPLEAGPSTGTGVVHYPTCVAAPDNKTGWDVVPKRPHEEAVHPPAARPKQGSHSPEVRTHLTYMPPKGAAPPTASQNGALCPPPPPDRRLLQRPLEQEAPPGAPKAGLSILPLAPGGASPGPEVGRSITPASAPEWNVPFRLPRCGSRRPSRARTGPLGRGGGGRRVHSGSGERGREVRNRYLLPHRSPPPRPPPRSQPRPRRSPPRPAPPTPWPRADLPAGRRPEATTEAAAAAAEQQPPPAKESREGGRAQGARGGARAGPGVAPSRIARAANRGLGAGPACFPGPRSTASALTRPGGKRAAPSHHLNIALVWNTVIIGTECK